MPPHPKKQKPDNSHRPVAKDKSSAPKDNRERSHSTLTNWHGMGNAFAPGF